MTYEPQPSLRSGLNDSQREALARLEGTDQPSEWQKGVFSSIRMCATSDADRQRVAAVQARWAEQAGSNQ